MVEATSENESWEVNLEVAILEEDEADQVSDYGHLRRALHFTEQSFTTWDEFEEWGRS
jgi:hypothetical protein